MLTDPYSRILFFPMSASVSPPDWLPGAILLLQQLPPDVATRTCIRLT
jgi:hypothetical protein